MKKWFSVMLLFTALSGFSQTDAFRAGQFNVDGGLALKGYDPVSYFTLDKAVKGKENIPFSYHGLTYHFASEADRESFRANPAKFEPQYGGWCAYAMGHDGTEVEVDPETFKISNGKLFLFYNKFFTNTLKTWNQDETKLHARADRNWQKILQP